MGISKDVKDFIRQRWTHTMANARSLAEAVAAMNNVNPTAPSLFRPPTVVCFDYTAALKFYPPDRVQNGHQYMINWFLPPIVEAFNQEATCVFICLDRGSPANKDLEHKKRYQNTEFMAVPEFDGVDIINDSIIPSPEEWEGFVNNKQVSGDLIAYITQRLFLPQERKENTFTPPPGKSLFLHGGRSTAPNRKVFPVPLPAPEVLFVKNELVEEKASSGLVSLVPRRTYGRDVSYTEQQVENLLEGEMACLYYAKNYPDDNVLFVTPDGDMLLQLLLLAADRIDPNTGRFRNTHYLKLRLDGNDDYVNINELYWAIQTDSILSIYENPVASFVAAALLLKNDYIHDFCFGVKSMSSESPLDKIKEINVPVIFQVLFSHARKYRSMFTIDPKIRMNMNGACLVHIDDGLWKQFVYDMYIFKYRNTIAKKHKIAPKRVTIDMVRTTLEGYKNLKVRVMDDKLIRVFGRQILWVLEYWHNAYRNDCLVNPPHALLNDMSYYGWIIQASGDCLPAEDVAKNRPEETYDLTKMFKRSWEEFNSDAKGDGESQESVAKRFRIAETLHKSKKNYVTRPHIAETPSKKDEMDL